MTSEAPILSLEGVSAFHGQLCALRDVDLTVAEGECVCVIGPNGAGKTTLLRAISGVLGSVSGRLTYRNRSLGDASPQDRVAAGLIHVPEGRLVFSTMSVFENLKIGGYQHRHEDVAGDIDRVLELFPRLRERRNQLAGSLSGGEQQMLAIGRALVGRPKLLMLDEPSMGVAPIVVAEIYREIRRLRELGVTVLLVEQNARLALTISDRAVVLNAGRVTHTASAQAILADENIHKLIFGH